MSGFKIHDGPVITVSASGPMLISGTADEVKLSNTETLQEVGIILQAQESRIILSKISFSNKMHAL